MLKTSNDSAMKDTENFKSYSQWKRAAIADDKATGKNRWKKVNYSRRYDYQNILSRYKTLRKLRRQKHNHELLFALNEGIHGNMGGMGKASLYKQAKFGTKDLINNYVNEVVASLEYIASDEVSDITLHDKLDFFQRASHCFGRSALLLSGAGSRLFFHIGVVKALWEEGLLPDIISGSSGGAIVASAAGTHTDEEIAKLFDPEYLTWEIKQDASLMRKIKKFGLNSVDQKDVLTIRDRIIPDLTFQEAYELTGRSINVTVAPFEHHQTSRLLNATTSPNVYVREATLASTALPPLFSPVKLAAKNVHGERQTYLPTRRWIDGSVSEDLPMKRLSRLYGVNHYVVSQINPVAVPFIAENHDWQTIASLTHASQNIIKECINASTAILDKPLSRHMPTASNLLRAVASIVRQDYTGDITILPPSRIAHPRKILSHKTEEEMMELIIAGEQATWPEIERIRVQTKISRTLDKILKKIEDSII